jgi:hypothetical protein
MNTIFISSAISWTSIFIGALWGFLFTTFIVDGFKLSKSFIIRILQLVFILLILFISLILIIFFYFTTVTYPESTVFEAKVLADLVSNSTLSENISTSTAPSTPPTTTTPQLVAFSVSKDGLLIFGIGIVAIAYLGVKIIKSVLDTILNSSYYKSFGSKPLPSSNTPKSSNTQ